MPNNGDADDFPLTTSGVTSRDRGAAMERKDEDERGGEKVRNGRQHDAMACHDSRKKKLAGHLTVVFLSLIHI